MTIRSYAEIQPVEPEWLIPGWVQLGGVTYIAGEGGVGKSRLTADWAMRVTRGLPMPGDDDGAMSPPGSVILVTAEDDPNMSMAWTLRAAGADMSRVYDMTDDFELPGSLPALREEIEKIGDVKLVVIDPLADVSSIPITSGNVRIRRTLTNPLKRFAASLGVSVVVIHHTTKAGRMAGSAAIMQAARQVLRVARSAQDERIRIISIEKTNVASDQAGGLAYTLTGDFPDVRVEYLSIPDAPGAQPREPSTREKLLAVLATAKRNGETSVATQD